MRTTIASFKSTGYIFLSTPTAAENSGFVPSLSLSLSFRLYEFPSLCSLTTRFGEHRERCSRYFCLPARDSRFQRGAKLSVATDSGDLLDWKKKKKKGSRCCPYVYEERKFVVTF